jgi:two-component system response regulator FixJ
MANKSPLRVLVVEDEPLMRWSIAETLAAAGHEVVEAEDSATALRALLEAPAVDIVLLDYRLRDRADLTLLADIHRRVPLTPVVLMTAFGTPALASSARRLGACDVLEKPFDIYGLERFLQQAREASCRSDSRA